MAKEKIVGDSVVLESVKGAWMISIGLPDGRITKVDFKKDSEGRFVAEVPVVLTYKDFFGEEVVFNKNFPQMLLNSYNKKDQYGEVTDLALKVVEVKKAPLLDVPVVVEAPISKRKKKNEEAVV